MFDDLLGLPSVAAAYRYGKRLGEAYPARAVLEAICPTFPFDPVRHAEAGLSSFEPRAGTHQEWLAMWNADAIHRHIVFAIADVVWRDARLEVHFLSFDPGQPPRIWIVGDTDEVTRGYFAEVNRWGSELRGEILVFAFGAWQKDERLHRDIKGATFDNLILRDDLKTTLKRELDEFFASKALYARYGVPWKRGILFIGPPGNGKTHAVKALLNDAKHDCLYVKSFDMGGNQFPQFGISAVFERARATAPCVLVLEDLDSLVGEHNRSFFLNELDGFASNEGIVVLATTNHPERLDPAILDRPSRFDRKYAFDLPGHDERAAYVRMWNPALEETLRCDDAAVEQVAAATEGFSFAYLRELFLSSLMRFASDGATGSFPATLRSVAASLREQIGTGESEAPNGAEQGAMGFSSALLPQMLAARGRHSRLNVNLPRWP